MSEKISATLSSLPFGAMIGGPLSACVEAQEQAAETTMRFIQNVGLNKESDTVRNVVFTYEKEGKSVRLSVPLLTIVPIPYIAIESVDISFKANVTAMETEHAKEDIHDTDTRLYAYTSRRNRYGVYSSYSTKKDSYSSQNSSYNVEATIDISVHARQDSMPAGLGKVLEILNTCISETPTDKQ